MSKLNPISEERKKERRDAVIKELKSLIFPSIILLIIAGLVFFVMTYQAKNVDDKIVPVRAYSGGDKPIVLENKDIKFEMDPLTTQFTVNVKSSGKTWYSVAQGAENDSTTTPEIRNRLSSPLVIVHSREEGLKTTYDSNSYSVANGIYEIEQGEDYVKVLYSLGKVEKEYVIPPAIRKDDFEALIAKMEKKDGENVKQFYKKTELKKLKDDEKEQMLADYPLLETETLYILRSSAKENNKIVIQKNLEAVGYTYEDYLADKELCAALSGSDTPIFNVSVVYRLDGDDLVVELPYNEIEHKDKLPIYNISLLPYFGAVDSTAEGFMFVPEGGGSLINVNNGKTTQVAYAADLYGRDKAISKDAIVHETEAFLNVFGASDGDNSFICILEDGASYATIRAGVAGMEHGYNYVNSFYTVQNREQYEVGEIANSDVFVYVENLPDETLVQRYSFVDSGSYVDMAKDYGKYLKNKYPEQFGTLNTDTSTPVTVKILGAVDKVKQILGVPVSKPLRITEFEEATEMVNDIQASGVDNLTVDYIGWCNGGVNQKILKKVKVLRELGGKKELQKFIDTAESNGVDVYLNGVTNYEYQSDIFDGFFSYTDAAKFLSKKRAELHKYSAITYAEREGFKNYYLLHGNLILKMIDNLDNFTTKTNTNIAFEDVGYDLSSDFYKKDYVSREMALNNQIEKLAAIKSSGKKVLIPGGNSYAIPYADVVTGMDLKGSEYTIIDETVPFYQIAIHGYVDYMGKPVNLSGNVEEEVLIAAEYGAGLSFTLMKESPFSLQKTLFTEYYASDFDAIWGDMSAIYDRFNKELGHTYNQEMVDHKNLSETVSMTKYADGTKVYVNYGYYDYKVDGITVPSRDYLVVR